MLLPFATNGEPDYLEELAIRGALANKVTKRDLGVTEEADLAEKCQL